MKTYVYGAKAPKDPAQLRRSSDVSAAGIEKQLLRAQRME